MRGRASRGVACVEEREMWGCWGGEVRGEESSGWVGAVVLLGLWVLEAGLGLVRRL